MYIALHKDGRYTKAKLVEGHVEEYYNTEEKFVEVYNIWMNTWFGLELTEELLKGLDIPNLGYIKTNTGFEVYDITKEEYTDEVLPIYVDVFGSIKKSPKTLVFKTPTPESVEASRVIYKKIEAKLEKMKHDECIKLVNELIEKGNGIAYIRTRNSLFQLLSEENIKILFSSNCCYVIGKTAKKPILDLYVPDVLVPMIIGKGGKKVKKMAEEIGAKIIKVKPIQN